MVKIEAIVKRNAMEKIGKELARNNCPGITIYQVHGQGMQHGLRQEYRGMEFMIEFLPKYKMEVVVDEDRLEEILDIIIKAANSSTIGDGKIFVSPISEAVRIRTGERGAAAIS